MIGFQNSVPDLSAYTMLYIIQFLVFRAMRANKFEVKWPQMQSEQSCYRHMNYENCAE